MLGLLVALAPIVQLAAAAALQPRAVSCPAAVASLSSASNLPSATAFCSIFLAIQTKTTAAVTTVTAPTRSVTSTSFVTNVLTMSAPTIVKGKTTRTTLRGTTTLPTTTTTLLATSTQYVDSAGNAIVRRAVRIFDAVNPLAARQAQVTVAAAKVQIPPYFQGTARADISSACSCLSLATPTFTRFSTATVTPVTTVGNTRTRVTVTTLPAIVTTSTFTQVKGQQVTAPAPIVTVTSMVIQDIQSCPPSRATTWVCPEGTGNDTNGGTGTEINCPVNSVDSTGDEWTGSCLYWSDDGSSDDAIMTDSAGNTRPTTYGDDDSDDCPTWADYTCAAASSRLVRKAAQLERAAAKLNTNKPLSLKQGGRRKFPSPAPKRGGHYRKPAH